jgi:hypothetical protein
MSVSNLTAGKKVVMEFKRRHPDFNLAAVDYASEASEVNRFKFLMPVAPFPVQRGKG